MNNKIKNIITSLLFSFILIAFFIINIIKKDDDISVLERRHLEKFPKLTINSLFNGTFFEKFDIYANDQFINRDKFRNIKVNLELVTKKNYNNLYLYNGYIIEQTYPLNEKSIINLTNKINSIKDNYLINNNVYYTIVPDKNYFVNNNNLKMDYNKLKNIMNSNLIDFKYIDIFNLLSLNDYYKTDSHWKEENIKDVALYIANNMGTDLNSTYKEKNITEFKGVYLNQLPIKMNMDSIKILKNEIIDNSIVYNYETKKYSEVYDLEKINSLDKYDIYLSGAAALIEIVNNSAPKRELIVFRDSYGSSLIPLLIEGYSKITVIDTRYISPKLLADYVDFNNKDVLFLYSVISINNSYSFR